MFKRSILMYSPPKFSEMPIGPIEVLARRFSLILQRDIGLDKLREVVARNKVQECPGVCHSHDFCDANMSMDEAYKEVFGESVLGTDEEGMTDEGCARWNTAWDLAKSREFFI